MQAEHSLESLDERSLLALTDFIQILRRLRRECPWDREQTHDSLRPMLIEEAYETVEAIEQGIDTGDYTELKKELGDLLLHILFHSELAHEGGHFTFEDVVRSESQKLIYRHPHVFSDTKADTPEQVAKNWEQLKRAENGRTSVLDGIPRSLPALQKAQRTQERAAKVGFDWPDSESVWEKVREEILEFENELNSSSLPLDKGRAGEGLDGNEQARKTDEFGDILFSLVNLARHEKIDPEHALREATKKFEHRFRQVEAEVERQAADSGRAFSDFSLAELDAIWDEVKRRN